MKLTKATFKTLVSLLTLWVSFSCFQKAYSQNDGNNKTNAQENNFIDFNETKSHNWLSSFDFDGDKKADTVSFDYTQGAHCCYKINIKLSSDNILRHYPFEMDGGYIAGVDSTLPEQFAIRDFDKDGLPEIFMKIETYNSENYPIPKKWLHQYGIKTNLILFDFSNGKLICKDYKPELELNLTGVWQIAPFVGSGWVDNYQFFVNGTFVYHLNQMVCDKRLLTLKGTFVRMNTNSIKLFITQKEVIVGGKKILANASCASKYEISGGELKNITLNKPKTKVLTLQDYQIDKSDDRNIETIKINGIKFWKLLKNPNDYK